MVKLKKALSLFFTFVLVIEILTIIPSTARGQENIIHTPGNKIMVEKDGYSYTVTGCYFDDNGSMQAPRGNIVIPSSYNGLPIKKIDGRAFSGDNKITTIVIPDSVTSIGVSAFSDCTSLTNIIIPDTVTTIDNWAFGDCKSLTTIKLPINLENISAYLFKGCSNLKTVNIPTGVTNICKHAFYNCNSLETITIPKTVCTIEDEVFYNCYLLSNINIPNNVVYIGKNCFYNCLNISTITLSKNLKSISDGLLFNCQSLNHLSIPSKVESIGEMALYNCKSLKTLTIPKSVTSIGEMGIGFVYNNEIQKNYDLVIYVNKGSFAEGFVKENGFNYISTTSKPKLKSIENTEYGVLTKWGKVSGADSYAVYRKTKGGKYKKIGTTTKTYYTDKKLHQVKNITIMLKQ